MKLTVLVDNCVLLNQNLIGEHGFSVYLEADEYKILFDSGYSDVFIRNAEMLEIDLLNLDYLVLSHGHDDHTWGISQFSDFRALAIKNGAKVSKPTVVTHPETFNKKYDGNKEIGCQYSQDQLLAKFNMKTSREPLWLSKNLVFLGEIPRLNDFEAIKPVCQVCKNNRLEDDYVTEDSALVYNSDHGLIIITGCSHSGICNIIEYAKIVCSSSRIYLVIGGLHLIAPDEDVLVKTIDYLKQQQIQQIYPCHCTDFSSKIKLAASLPVKEAGVGLFLTIE